MRKFIPFVLILATSMGSIAVQEAAAGKGDNGRGGRGGESVGSYGDTYTHYQNPNHRYRRGRVICTVMGTSGMVYDQDLRGWRRIPNCNGRYILD